MNFTELDKIFKDMKEINGLVKESKRRTPGIMNIAEIMRQHRQENEHSDILSFLLDPEEDHNHPEFGTCFLNLLTERGLKIRGKSITKVKREAVTGAMRRMDIFIETDSEKIIIENKIDSGDQENQIEDYVFHVEKTDGNVFVVYLTLWGNEPSEYSISSAQLKELKKDGRFICLSYKEDILDWLGRLETKENEDVLKAGIIQYMDVVKGITNQRKEWFNMNQAIAKELYEKYGKLTRDELKEKLHPVYDFYDNINLVLFMNFFKDICREGKDMYGLEMKLFYDDDEYEYENAAEMKKWEEKVLVNQKRFGVCCRYDNGGILDFFVKDLKGNELVAACKDGEVWLDAGNGGPFGGSSEIKEKGYDYAIKSNGWIAKAVLDVPFGGNGASWEEIVGEKISTRVAGAFKAARPKA